MSKRIIVQLKYMFLSFLKPSELWGNAVNENFIFRLVYDLTGFALRSKEVPGRVAILTVLKLRS